MSALIDEWIPAALASEESGVPKRVLRSIARTGKIDCIRGKDVWLGRNWYRAPELRSLVRAHLSTGAKKPRDRNLLFAGLGPTKQEAAEYLSCPTRTINYLLSIGKIHQFNARPEFLTASSVREVCTSLQRLERNGTSVGCAGGGRKLWFRRSATYALRKAFTVTSFVTGRTKLSAAARRSKIACAQKFSPGELVTKADAAFITGYSVRGVENLVARRQLKPVPLGKRNVAFKRVRIEALAKRKTRRRKNFLALVV